MNTSKEQRWTLWDDASCSSVFTHMSGYVGPCRAQWLCNADRSPCCLKGAESLEGFVPRLPRGSIERCNYWQDDYGQYLCGFWGWKGKLRTVVPYCRDKVAFGCEGLSSTVGINSPSHLFTSLTGSSQPAPDCSTYEYPARFWRNHLVRGQSGFRFT